MRKAIQETQPCPCGCPPHCHCSFYRVGQLVDTRGKIPNHPGIICFYHMHELSPEAVPESFLS